MSAVLEGIEAAVLTISSSRTPADDRSGPEAARILAEAGASVSVAEIIPDDRALIAGRLRALADGGAVSLVVTSGGTGVARHDVTPDATSEVSDRLVPGMAEAMRRASSAKTPFAALSRAVVGIRGSAMIVNLPGSPGGVRDCLGAVLEPLAHGLALIGGRPSEHRQS